MDKPALKFPANFVWGASTSAHQVEGDNHNDWSEWEQHNAQRLAQTAEQKFGTVPSWPLIKEQATNPKNYLSGRAADHYHRYHEDIAILKNLGLNAYRFSVEWSRVQPQPGQWNQAALAHYAEVIKTLKQNGIEPFVTLWHRTLPLWVTEAGGWENQRTVAQYIEFVHKIVTTFHDSVRFWLPLNEPEFEVLSAYLGGAFPPQVRNPWRAYRVFRKLIQAHRQAFTTIHGIQPQAQVGIPQAAITADPYRNYWRNRVVIKALNYFSSWKFLNAVRDHADFFGVQYYTRPTINIGWAGNNNYSIPFLQQIDLGLPKSDMGWEINPDGIAQTILENWRRYHKPIYITENGLPDSRDLYRAQFIEQTLTAVNTVMNQGVDLRGYFHWSLLDNFEWDKGFWPKFGLVEFDPKTFERKVRPSAYVYKSIVSGSEHL